MKLNNIVRNGLIVITSAFVVLLIAGSGIFRSAASTLAVLTQPVSAPSTSVTGERLESVQNAGDNELQVSQEMIQKIGVRVVPVIDERLSQTVRSTGTFVMDEKAVRAVSLKVSGWVETLWADYNGKMIKAGDKLLELYSPDLVATQEEYLLAYHNIQTFLDGSEQAQTDARALLDAARWRLSYWDLTDQQIDTLEKSGVPQRTITFYASSSGEIMHKAVVEGEFIESGQKLMEITDISTVWLLVDIHEKDLPWVKPGAAAQVELVSDPGNTYNGRVDFIYHMMDSEMRTARARIIFPGAHGSLLKPGTFATVKLKAQTQPSSPVVPEEAVIRTGERQLVVKSLGDGRFRLHEVRTGLSTDGKVQILAGLKSGDEVVSSGQFMLDSEARLLRLSVQMLNPTEEI